MYGYRKLLRIALAVLLALTPVVAQAQGLTNAEVYVQTALWAAGRCTTAAKYNTAYLPEHWKPEVEQLEIKLNTDKILAEVGPEVLAAVIARGYKVEYRWSDATRQWEEVDVCRILWKLYGPEGRGYVVAGGVTAEWKAKQELLHQLQEREKQLIEQAK